MIERLSAHTQGTKNVLPLETLKNHSSEKHERQPPGIRATTPKTRAAAGDSTGEARSCWSEMAPARLCTRPGSGGFFQGGSTLVPESTTPAR